MSKTLLLLPAGSLRLWSGGATKDPWASTSSTTTALQNFQDYWNTNMQGVERSIAHMLSGMATGGGASYIGTLCDWYASKGASNSYGERIGCPAQWLPI